MSPQPGTRAVMSDVARLAGVSHQTVSRVLNNHPSVRDETRQRVLRAIRQLIDAGIDANVGMAPILPGLSDRPERLRDVVKAARDAGATGIWTNVLYLRPGAREHFLENLARDWPELLPRYQRLYAGRAYLGKKEIEPVRREVADLRHRFEVGDRRTVRLLPSLPDAQLELPLLVGGEAKAAAQIA